MSVSARLHRSKRGCTISPPGIATSTSDDQCFIFPRTLDYNDAMMDFLRNPRRVLIVVHDLVVTALALLATFYVRFENGGFYERLHGLLVFLPVYLIYAGAVYW